MEKKERSVIIVEKSMSSELNNTELIAYESENVTENGKSSLDVYLEDGKMEMKLFSSIDVLQYWKEHTGRYGELATMECDVLSIPITTVASEFAFSIGARVLNKYRSCILSKHVQALLCTRNWVHGYKFCEDDGRKEDVPAATDTDSVVDQIFSK